MNGPDDFDPFEDDEDGDFDDFGEDDFDDDPVFQGCVDEINHETLIKGEFGDREAVPDVEETYEEYQNRTSKLERSKTHKKRPPSRGSSA